ncbi:hypothetical protein [Arthrobacter sp. ES1]|uniref:hypothetical protein n=1 Tax=Arthrobacter sp. ES1 TaxID=1897056 RepID=UPI001CFFB435|nr:hypothetical protein [Arthrobacter sp. ES1]MCB5280647.1 hypothetical protein [Arthrobacter sp. ES1]
MKFTQSRDGVKRCNIRITIRMDRDDIINALATSTNHEMIEDLPEKLGAAEIWKRVRQAIAEYGESTAYWAEQRDDADEAREWATANVDRILKEKR